MSISKKRSRTTDAEGQENEPGYRESLMRGCKLMGGVKLCREEELTRAVLLEFLKLQGAIEEVKGLVEVAVQTMAGTS